MNNSMQQTLNGILVLDKPPNISSASLTGKVKKLLGAKKAGHTGTLDPFATGVMVICIGKATRLARFFLHGPKTYRATLYLGVETDTLDATGKILATRKPEDYSEEDLKSVFKQFEGKIMQTPPVYSALKQNGVALYKLARKGAPVQKAKRPVWFYRLKILDVRLPEVCFEASCSAGAYIRSLCADIGTRLGCGGHLKTLRRTESCGFSLNGAVTPLQLEKIAAQAPSDKSGVSSILIPMAQALRFIPQCVADTALTKKIANGRPVGPNDLSLTAQNVILTGSDRLHDEAGSFFKVVSSQGDLLAVLSQGKTGKTYKYCCVFPP